MKRCPTCNRTYPTDKQKFCTQDGGLLVDADDGQTGVGQTGVGQGETILISSAQLDSAQLDDAPTKPISRELISENTGQVDPLKTVMSRPAETKPASPRELIFENTGQVDPLKTVMSRPAEAKPASPRELISENTGQVDPFKTVMSRPAEAKPASPRDTQDVSPLATQYSMPDQPPPQPPISAPLSSASGSLPATGSGPIDLSNTMPTSAPTMHLSGSVPIAASLPTQQFAAPPPGQQVQPATAPRPTKKSRVPLVLGILAVLFILGLGGLGAAYFFFLKPMLAKKVVVVEPPRPPKEPTPNVESTPKVGNKETNVVNEPPPYSPPADAVEFVNSKKRLDGKLAEHYVDFSFYYPNRWQKDPGAGAPGASNFAKVERRLPPDFTQENFAVGWYSSAGSAEADRSVFHSLAQNLSLQFAKSFSEYSKVSEGPTKAGVYDGYEFRFESMSRNTDKGDIKIWGRVILVPPVDGGKNGVTLLMLATSLAPELRSVADVGVRGELPMMLESFRFGKN
jgi:hypothetical protein